MGGLPEARDDTPGPSASGTSGVAAANVSTWWRVSRGSIRSQSAPDSLRGLNCDHSPVPLRGGTKVSKVAIPRLTRMAIVSARSLASARPADAAAAKRNAMGRGGVLPARHPPPTMPNRRRNGTRRGGCPASVVAKAPATSPRSTDSCCTSEARAPPRRSQPAARPAMSAPTAAASASGVPPRGA